MVWPFRRKSEQRSEQRSISSVPWDVGGESSGVAGQSRALTLIPVFSATSLIAMDVATLPMCGYRMVGGQAQRMPSLPALFGAMVADGTIVAWLHRVMTSLLLRGNAYGLVLGRDGFGFPTRVEWLSPDDVTVLDSAPSGPGSFLLPLYYWQGRSIPVEDMVHVSWYSLPWKRQGLSPIAAFARTIGVGLSIVDYGASWFEGGGFPPGTFKNTETTVDQTTAEAMGARLDVARRRRRPLVYGKDWDYNPISVPPNEAQFIDASKLSATQIAGIYHVPPEWVGGAASTGLHYTSDEQSQIHYAQHAVRPWVELLESVFRAMLPSAQYVKFDLDALVRTDLKTKHEVYAIDAGIGLRTVDEMRAVEGLPPLPKPEPVPAVPSADGPPGGTPPTGAPPTRSVDPPVPPVPLFGPTAAVDLAARRAAWNGSR